MKARPFVMGVIFLGLAIATRGAQINDATKQLARDIFKQLVEINTTDSVGSSTVAAQAMAVELGTVKSRLSRGRAQLRDLLAAKGELPTSSQRLQERDP